MRRARLGTAVLALAGIAAWVPSTLAQDTPPRPSEGGARGGAAQTAQQADAARPARGEPREPARTTRAEARETDRETQEEAPDLAFLEFLGGWQAGDDEWVLISEWLEEDNEARAEEADEDEPAERADGAPAPRGAARGAAEAEARREREQRNDDEKGG